MAPGPGYPRAKGAALPPAASREDTILSKFNDFTPSKGMLAWTAVGASALTMVLGFTWGGWTTGGSADQMARAAATGARVELASTICAANFVASPTARAQQEELLALAAYQQRGYVEKQPWALMPGETSVNRQVADSCAKTIAGMEPGTLAAAEEALVPGEPEVDPG